VHRYSEGQEQDEAPRFPRVFISICSTVDISHGIISFMLKDENNGYIRITTTSSNPSDESVAHAHAPSSSAIYQQFLSHYAIEELKIKLGPCISTAPTIIRFTSPFLVAVYNPLLLMEEQPWISNKSFKLTILADSQYTYIHKYKDQSFSYFNLASLSIKEDKSMKFGNGINVRDLLKMNIQTGQTKQMANVAVRAIIMKKTLLLDEYNDINTDFSRKRSRESENNIDKKKVCLVLRDASYGDCIQLYIQSTLVSTINVGSVVTLRNFAISNPKSNRKVYLRSSTTTSIGVDGILPDYELERMSQHKTYPGEKLFEDLLKSVPPPLSTIRTLFTARSYDRCLYRIIGSVVMLKKLNVALLCRDCRKQAVGTSCSIGIQVKKTYYCPQCRNVHSIYPHVDCQVSFDDNTGEAVVRLEGDIVYDVLHSPYIDPERSALKQLQKAIEGEAWRSGKYSYDLADGFLKHSSASSTINTSTSSNCNSSSSTVTNTSSSGGDITLDDYDIGLECDLLEMNTDRDPSEDTLAFAALVSGKFTKQPTDAMIAYITILDRSRLVDMWAKIDTYKATSRGNISNEDPVRSRIVKIQEVNKHKGYLVYHRPCRTLVPDRLELSAYKVDSVTSQELVGKCNELLQRLSSLSV
jgi:hypothetical protein